ncbi:hypothetical protein EPUS_09270 [Endocarpon pusillum Z07020]|uniref:Uncharacterized protein n=1 Tax=Endocarpon pusillum (strain Z07020 / HMAS-L-300199) TaxID=1263415 RepID=U1GBE8_ENDPU|nr:uncharacterized protein EPUS_09270 [Endocarpon pusillum Z07020]ERF69363.1 hypothetical protein EPUS_09270 [Endocarpon pusillum Z07020]
MDETTEQMMDKATECFRWLSRDARGSTYISYSQFSHLSACSFDFGAEGYAGSCNYGGELLHLSAPSNKYGLVFGRGNFSRSLYASLARAQREFGGLSTFGLKVSRDAIAYVSGGNNGTNKGSSFRLGKMVERGCFNYRWPLNEYSLLLNENMPKTKEESNSQTEEEAEKETGTCVMFSFVMDGICYQVLRLEQGCRSDVERCPLFPSESQIVLKIGGPVWLESLAMAGQQSDGSIVMDINDCSTEDCLRIWDKKHEIGLDAMVWQLDLDGKNYQRLKLTKQKRGADSRASTPESPRLSTATEEEEPIVPDNTYDAVAKLPDMKKAGVGRRNATFVAAIRLIEPQEEYPKVKRSKIPTPEPIADPKAEEPPKVEWPKIPTPEEIYNYVAANPSSLGATGNMWETIFLERDLHTDSVSEYTEVSLVGRCLEKILQVDIVPRDFPTLALVSNLFVLPRVDFKSLFWKVRFLAKVYKFLFSLDQPGRDQARPIFSESDTKEDTNKNLYLDLSEFDRNDRKCMLGVAENQRNRILDTVENVVRFLSEVLRDQTDHPNPLLQDSRTPDESDYYYITITIWYVIKSFPERNWELKDSSNDKEQANCSYLPANDCNFGKANKDKIPLLQWYHYGSILSLSRQGILPNIWQTEGLDRRVSRLGRAARIALAAKLLSKSPYSVEDEIVDRLAFLAHELGLENLNDNVDTVASLSIRRVKQRDFTRYINPGWLPPHEEGYTSGPWEIHALCHNSRLNVLSLEDERKAEEVQSYKQKLCHFLNSEAMVVSCWERTHSKARKGWLRSEATSVLGSTLLDIHQKMSGPQKVVETVQRRYPISRQVDAHESPTGDGLPPIEWTTFSPPRQYHPDNFVNSLDDTPHLYQPPVIDKMNIPAAIRGYAESQLEAGFTIDDLRDALGEMPGSVVLSDIVAIDLGLSSNKCLRIRPGQAGTYIARDIRHIYHRNTPSCHRRKPPKYSPHQECQEELVQALYDSLADQNVQHRFLTVRKQPERLIPLLVYVIHPESTACLNNHLLHIPRFLCQKGNTWIARITLGSWLPKDGDDTCSEEEAKLRPDHDTISLPKELKPVKTCYEANGNSDKNQTPRIFRLTLRSWLPKRGDDICSDEEAKLRPDHDPISLAKELTPVKTCYEANGNSDNNQEPKNFRLIMSSVILSTNAFGDFSKCTIISEDIGDNNLMKLAEDSSTLWRKFIHQPQTASEQYNNAIKELASLVDFKTVFLSEEEWSEDYTSFPLFKLGLWSLDSLYRLQKSLKASVDSVLEAKEELMQQINDGPGKRSGLLERICQEYLGTFESNLLSLTIVKTDLERKIELHSRYKDALSAVLGLRDSRASLQQNSTIQKLTYLTIVYLPIGLMAAIFAIPHEQRVTFESMGRGWFIGCVFLMSAATYTLAIHIQNVLTFPGKSLARVWHWFSRSDKLPH